MNNRTKLIVTILDKDSGGKAAELFAGAGVPLHYALPGQGTANSDLLDYLGLGSIGKDVVLSLVPESQAHRLLQQAREEFHLSKPGKGIVFVLPLAAISRSVEQLVTQGAAAQEQEETAMEKGKSRLIVAVVNTGNTDAVMAAAKSAGARGGTVLHGHRLGYGEDAEQKIRPEKDIVTILVPVELQRPILEAVNRSAGAATDCRGVLFSLPVDEAAGLPGF